MGDVAGAVNWGQSQKSKVLKWMIAELEFNRDNYIDMGSVNLTKLAEGAAHAFDHDEWLDDETHWVWDVAITAADA